MDHGASVLIGMSQRAEQTARKYFGDTARGYESKRVGQDKWKAEQAIVESWLKEFPAGTHVLDCPCGTGRFFEAYIGNAMPTVAIDVSPDMLRIARQKAPAAVITCQTGNIFALDMPDKSVDVAVAVRIMNLIDAADMTKALAELQRVARKAIIFNLRIWHEATRFRRPQKMQTLHDALTHEWHIERNVPIHEDDFRMFMLCAG